MASRLEKRITDQRKTRRNRFLLILTCFLLFVSVAGATYYWATGGTFEKARRVGAEVVGLPHKVNILVMGVDERSDDVGRSDTMMVVTVDTSTKQVSLLSVPRDTRVKIPGNGWDKINHAYAYGGHKLSQKAVEDLLGIPMDYYVLINFAAFNKIVDAVGGVTINVEKRMYYEDPYDNLVIDLQPGEQKLDGRTAIKYVRYRDEEGDIGRIARQQKFLKALLDEVTSPFILPRVPSIIREVNAAVTTDMTTADMIKLAKLLNDAGKTGLKAAMVPGKPAYIDDVSYWLPDITELRAYVAASQGVTTDDKYFAEVRTTASQYERSIPKEMKIVELPKKPVETKDIPKPAVTDSKVQNKPSTTEKAKVPESKAVAASGKLQFEVINASGITGAGEKMAATLRGQGYNVVSVSGSGSGNKNTLVVANSNEASGKLTGLPFNYALQINNDSSRANVVQVIVGKDYAN
ncbi:Transcriptional regulator LytR [Sporomusa ovata DSM 2662]|uniref:Cell envelope-associated transcriptional attenuator LytR-CpsA-Psr, subfamily M (As in PMID19099556) n=1 Tax=Sporomusa ovata TaxID=2378 RepID=A0A0U1KUZ2_9FIRM|nr:LCP family protein [Sporomusa ovata]EQB26988.1 transcriptional regulator LytR [Sporomusa ovata DSM 2662]CQR71095.1 Cell envelope-associated transcriptional attenuator LytR-CpsA-Psr, subfamily M (as in PMID19099556) [Sporomusa ovata]